MRKSSSYKPKPIIRDVMGYIKEGNLPLTAATTTMMRVGIANHGAMERLVKGKGTGSDVVALGHMLTTAGALASYGIGEEWIAELREARAALDALTLREGNFTMRANEITALNLAIQIHDAQLKQCTVKELETAIKAIKKALRHNHKVQMH